MIIDEKEITAKAEEYADKKMVHFRPLIESYRKAIINAYVDAYIAGMTSQNAKIRDNIDNIINME